MLRRPTSTLFPYTTLFRSPPRRPTARCTSKTPSGSRRPRARSPSRRDRKSTRLNSSHANISYAVFCLKKKKINKHMKLLEERLPFLIHGIEFNEGDMQLDT